MGTKIQNSKLEVKWSTALPAKILTSEMTIHKEFIYYPAENHRLYKVNLDGEISDSVKIAGTTSKFFFIKDTICYIGGSDFKLRKGLFGDLDNVNNESSQDYLPYCYFVNS